MTRSPKNKNNKGREFSFSSKDVEQIQAAITVGKKLVFSGNAQSVKLEIP